MGAWFKRWWPLLPVAAYLIFAADFTASSLWTCHPPPEGSTEAIKAQYAENCSYLHGPFFVGLRWLLHFIDEHDGFFTVVFTAGLVAFTAALWRSTDKLWKAGELQRKSTEEIAAQANKTTVDFFMDERRPWVGILDCSIASNCSFEPESASVPLMLLVKNFGPSPAERVLAIGRVFSMSNVKAAIEFAHAPIGQIFVVGYTIFPGQEEPMNSVAASLSVQDGGAWPPTTPMDMAIVSGAIDYAFGRSTTVFQTPFAYMLQRTAGGPLFTGQKSIIPAHFLDLTKMPVTMKNI